MSDITNPGLVNVADQAFKPDLKVDSLAIPLDDDVLVPVADQDIDPVTGNPLSVTFPTPAEVIVSGQAPGTPSQDFALVANSGSNNVTPLTLSGGTWSAGTPVAVGTGPYGVAISPDGTRALVANYDSNNVTPLTLSGGTWTAGTPVAVGTNPDGVAISPDGTRALVANYDSNNVTPLTLSGGTWSAGTPVAVGANPYGVAISPDGARALVANGGSNNVTPLTLSGGTWSAGTPVAVGATPYGVAISPDGARALVANISNNNVTPLTLSGGTWTAGTPVAVGTAPVGVAISPDGTRALVANFGSNNVTPLTLSGGTWTAGTPVAVGTTPVGVAISPDGARALVANLSSNNVTPLTLSGGTWSAGTPVAVGANPYSLGPSMIYESRCTPSQDFATIPGQPPLYLPFPPAPSDPRIQAQSVTAGIIAEITVGPGMSIQTNLTPDVIETYTVTSVLDADTLQPVVVPIPPNFGIFSSVWGTGGVTTVVSPLDMTGLISDGQAVTLAAQAGHPTDYDGVWTISNLLDLSGTFDIAITGGAGKTILGSSFPIDGDLGFGKRIAISGSPIAAYNGNHALLAAESIGSPILSIMAGTNPLTTSTVVSLVVVGLVPGQLVRIGNTGGVPPAGYDGYWTASNVIYFNGSIQSIANGPPTKVTVNLFGSTTGLVDGQIVTLSQTLGTAYDGQYPISNVTPTSFDIVHAFAGSSTGNWTAYTFDITTPFTGTPSSPSEFYDSNTITIDVPFAGWSPGTGNYAVNSFEISATFTVTSQGTWTYNPPQQIPTTRYRLYVTPSDLISFGITMLGRQITFGDTAANPDVSRNITGYTSAWIVIDKSEPSNIDDSILQSDPAPGDTFTLDTQRQGSEVITSGTGIVQDVTLLPIPAAAPPAVPYTADAFPQGQAVVAVSTGQQPGQPIITSGVQVPTAINVNVADQPPIGVGLPPNVFP